MPVLFPELGIKDVDDILDPITVKTESPGALLGQGQRHQAFAGFGIHVGKKRIADLPLDLFINFGLHDTVRVAFFEVDANADFTLGNGP